MILNTYASGTDLPESVLLKFVSIWAGTTHLLIRFGLYLQSFLNQLSNFHMCHDRAGVADPLGWVDMVKEIVQHSQEYD